MSSAPLWLEGERIPDDRILDIFQQPPNVPPRFSRSSLIIGTRGAGKTTLFRYQKAVHERQAGGIAVHINLADEFSSLSRHGYGSLSLEIPRDIEPMLIGKATSLLALSLVERLARKGILTPFDALHQCLPAELSGSRQSSGPGYLSEIARKVARSPLELFEGIAYTRVLPPLVTALVESPGLGYGALLLLFDKADMVSPPALVPIVELLDQSRGFVALLALRPGHTGEALATLLKSIVPGDHFGIYHLGAYPRSREWTDFMEVAVQAQFGDLAKSMPQELISWVMAISRDSPKAALELLDLYALRPTRDGLLRALEFLRDTLLTSAQTTTQKFHPSFASLLGSLTKEARQTGGYLGGPLVLSFRQPGDLFGPRRVNRFVDLGLRCGAFCIPEGMVWHPGLSAWEVEIQPILVWQKGDPFWTVDTATTIRLERTEREVLSRPWARHKELSVFVAYRIDFSESKEFRSKLESRMGVHPDLDEVRVVAGEVPAGVPWADFIRDRIQASRLVVGDVTGPRNDVMFELGFAYGLGRPIIPVVSGEIGSAQLPVWLGATQLGSYKDEAGLTGIISSIYTHLSDPSFGPPPPPPKPIAGLAAWLRELPWNQHALAQFKATAEKEGLKWLAFGDEDLDRETIRQAASGSLVIISLDNTQSDALMHFISGAVAAKPKAGYEVKTPRTVLVLDEPTGRRVGMAAHSLIHSGVARVISLDEIAAELRKFGQRYRAYLKSAPKRRRS